MSKTSIEMAAENRGATAAKGIQNKNVAVAFSDGSAEADRLLNIARSVDPDGEQRAIADALTTISKSRKEAVENAKTIISYKNLDDGARLDLAQGKATHGIKPTSDMVMAATQSLFDASSPNTLRKLLKTLDIQDISNNLGLSPSDTEDLFANWSDAIGSSKLRPSWFDFGVIAKLQQGKDPSGNPMTGPYGDAGIDQVIMANVRGGKVKAKDLQADFSVNVEMFRDAVNRNQHSMSASEKQVLKATLADVLDKDSVGYTGMSKEAEALYKEIDSWL